MIAKQKGYQVSGADRQFYPPMLDQLQKSSIDYQHDLNVLTKAEGYIVGNIMSRGMPVVEELLETKKPFYSGPQWLYEHVLKSRKVIAIAGTHGKTTTASMLTWILEYAGLSPGFLVGGVPNNFNISARLGEDSDDNWFVIEADEYDTAFFDKRSKFMHYHPTILLINNVEFDHADIYANLGQIIQQFHYLIRTLKPSQQVFFNPDCEGTQALLQLGCWSKQYPIGKNVLDSYYVHQKKQTTDRLEDSLEIKLKRALQQQNLLGDHNVANALAAINICAKLNIEPLLAIDALAQFKGVKRRQERLWTSQDGNIELISDFAHHPTSIRSILRAFKQVKKTSSAIWQLIVLFDPASNSMKKGAYNNLLSESFQALQPTDTIIMMSSKQLQWQPTKVLSNLPCNLHLCENAVDLLQKVIQQVNPPSTILILSNGSFQQIPQRLQPLLEEHFG